MFMLKNGKTGESSGIGEKLASKLPLVFSIDDEVKIVNGWFTRTS